MTVEPIVLWTALGVLLTPTIVFLGWLLRIERALAHRMSFEQHERICDKREERSSNDLATLVTKLDEREKYSIRHRETVQRDLRELAIDIAVVQSELDIRRRRRISRDDGDMTTVETPA